MRTDFDIKMINDTVLDVFVEPALERLQDPTFNNSSLELNWVPDSFRG